MADWISLGSSTWGGTPKINVSFAYEKRRVGADMQYRAQITVGPCSGASYFGYPIYAKVSIDGSLVHSHTMKNASPKTWTSNYIHETEWYTVSNKTAGTVPISFRLHSTYRDSTYPYTMNVDPAASAFSTLGNGTLDTAQTIAVTQYSSSFTHSIKAVCGSSTLYIKADGSTSTSESEAKHNDCSISFKPPLDWARENTSGSSLTVKFTLTTYSGSTVIGDPVTKTVTMTIPTVNPSVARIDVQDITSIPGGVSTFAQTWGLPVQGFSRLRMIVIPNLAYDSPITSFIVKFNGGTYTGGTGPEFDFTSDILQYYGSLPVEVTLTDKRGGSCTITRTVTALRYDPPTVTFAKVGRCNSDGSANDQGKYAVVQLNYTVTPLENGSTRNSGSIDLVVKKSSEDEYSEPVFEIKPDSTAELTDTGSLTYVFEADADYSYDIKASMLDMLDGSEKTTSVSTAYTIMHWRADGHGMGLGKLAEIGKNDNIYGKDVLDIGYQTRLYGGLLYTNIEPDTDFNDLKTPNFYSGFDIAKNNYSNCPLSDGSFTLVVQSAGGHGQARQFIAECDKLFPEKYERYCYASSGWGDWIKLSPTNLYESIRHTQTTSNAFEHVGKVTIPAYRFYTITARGIHNNASCKAVIIGDRDDDYKSSYAACFNEDIAVKYPSCTYSGYTGESAITFHIWGKWAGANLNTVQITGFYLPY